MGTTILTVSYTKQGQLLANQIEALAAEHGDTAHHLYKPKGTTWIKSYWEKTDQIVFVGAAGIAVRSIASCLRDKLTDPGVVVVDEKGTFFIPILSGHVGGANAFAIWLSEKFKGTPVLTTATDVQGCFAVDTFAKRQELIITDRNKVKLISSAILRGEWIGLYCTHVITGSLPKELRLCDNDKQLESYCYNLVITEKPKAYADKENCLCLCPKNLILGIGCKRGTSYERLKQFVQSVLGQLQAEANQICKVVSIDLKQDEPGLMALAKEMGVVFETYSKEVLESIQTVSNESEFVKQVTGIGNVCERAALYECQDGRLILPKYAKDGMTIAVAAKSRGVYFE